TGISDGIYREKGSKFIAMVFPVENETMVKERLAEVQKQYFDARHHCYAYILGPDKSAYRINDNGEPSGTAGRPIYGQLLSKDLTNTLVVVVRYFGGIKLGVSGLINAYKTAAKEALDKAVIIEKTIDENYKIYFDYTAMNQVMQILKDDEITITNQFYEDRYIITFKVRKREADRFTCTLKKIPTLELTVLLS
ncbi:MAG: YigZ family protein, partial [Bacteroidales bacterium]